MSWCARPQIMWTRTVEIVCFFWGGWVLIGHIRCHLLFRIFWARERLGPTKFFPYIQPEQAAAHGMGRGHRGTLNRMRFGFPWWDAWPQLPHIHTYTIFWRWHTWFFCLDVKGSMSPHCSCERSPSSIHPNLLGIESGPLLGYSTHPVFGGLSHWIILPPKNADDPLTLVGFPFYCWKIH